MHNAQAVHKLGLTFAFRRFWATCTQFGVLLSELLHSLPHSLVAACRPGFGSVGVSFSTLSTAPTTATTVYKYKALYRGLG